MLLCTPAFACRRYKRSPSSTLASRAQQHCRCTKLLVRVITNGPLGWTLEHFQSSSSSYIATRVAKSIAHTRDLRPRLGTSIRGRGASSGGSMAVGAASRRYIGPLLCINLVMHAAVLGIAGWSLNKFIDRETHRHLGGNTATGYLLVFSLVAGVVGACSVLPALLHVRAPWHSESLAAAASTGLVSWALTALAFGLACKHITLGNRGRRLRTLEAFITISTLTQLFYLLLLHAGALSGVLGVGQACGNHGEACCREIPRGELAADHKTAGGVPSPDA